MNNKTQASIEQIEATNKAYKLRHTMNDNDLSAKLEISKVTLYTRLKRNNWKNHEILFLEYHSNPKLKTLVDSLKILKN